MDFLFDIGGVILKVDFDRSLRRLLPDPPADLPRRFADIMTRAGELETGRLDPRAFVADASRRLGFHGPHAEFVAAWCDVFEPITPMWHAVERLAAAGHRLILFSNTNDLHAAHVLASYDVFRHFPHAVFSHKVGAMKPDEPIYHHAIASCGLLPARTAYVDDLPANVATGRRLGFLAWQYHPDAHPAFLAWLDRLLESHAQHRHPRPTGC